MKQTTSLINNSYLGIQKGQTDKSPERQGLRPQEDRGVLSCTLRNRVGDNAVFSGESAVCMQGEQ